jgi:hypothetical protein
MRTESNRRQLHEKHLMTFAAFDCRVEGWFKGELLVLFQRLSGSGRIASVEREVNVPRRDTGARAQVDFRIQLGEELHLCELKSLCISRAAGTPRNLQFYFRDDSVGLIRDFRKLDSLDAQHKWGLALIYPRPDMNLWSSVTSTIVPELRHWQPANDPSNASEFVFVSLWRCTTTA